jgi:homoserine kinase
LKNLRLKREHIHVFAPATVANVGCGFDIFGFAVHQPGDELELQVTDRPGVSIEKITGAGADLPLDVELNTAGKGLLSFYRYLKPDFGLSVVLHKKMPVGSGMGSSAASAVASVFALNELLAEPVDRKILLKYAIAGERITSGESVHLDNIAACLWGGMILVQSKNPVNIVELPVPDDLYCTIVHPQIEIHTRESRQILKKEIPLVNAVTQWGNIAGFVSALYCQDYSLIAKTMLDVVAEPVRSILIPHFAQMRILAKEAGALGLGISGSGPSVFALSAGKKTAEAAGNAIGRFLGAEDIGHDIFVSEVNREGPKVVE